MSGLVIKYQISLDFKRYIGRQSETKRVLFYMVHSSFSF